MSLSTAVAAFKAWAETVPATEKGGEWECHYAGWPDLYAESSAFIDRRSHERWTTANKRDLLFVIARDNEDELLADYLARRPRLLLDVATDALAYGEPEAKWQIAHQLGAQGFPSPAVEAVLLRFFGDDDEYVRRQALLTLGQIGSDKTEACAVKAWETDHQYQRIAALYALRLALSAKLPEFLRLAFEDGRKALVTSALRLSADA